MKRKILGLIFFFILFILQINNLVFASATNTKIKSFNNSPRISYSTSSSNFSDVTIKVKDNNKILSVELYKNNTKIEFSSKDISNEIEHIYTISHKDVLKKKDTNFTIVAKDMSGNVTTMDFTVKVKNGCYKFDLAPRFKNWMQSSDGKQVIFTVRDLAGVEKIRVKDSNNNNKIVYENSKKTTAGDYAITLDITNCKTDAKGNYSLYIEGTDSTKKSNPRTMKMTVKFKIEKLENVSSNKLILNKSIIVVDEMGDTSTDYGKINHKIAKLEVVNTDEPVTWSVIEGEQVAKVDSTGKVTGLNGGTAVIRVALKSNPSVYKDCNVTVVHSLYENVTTTKTIKAKIKYSSNETLTIKKGTNLILHGMMYNKKNSSEVTVTLPDGRIGTVNPKYLKFKSYYIEKKYSNEVYTEYVNNLEIKSKTNYLFWVNQGSQRILVYEKDSNGVWKLKENEATSTGDREHKGGTGIRFNLEVQDFKSESTNPSIGKMIHVRYITSKKYYGNTIHVGVVNSKPNSHGCPHITVAFRNRLFNKYSNGKSTGKGSLVGTRVIYY